MSEKSSSALQNGVEIQGPVTVGGNCPYPSTSAPSHFNHGTGLAINGGEEGNNNLMWLLDFKLDFFNDQDTGKSLI